MCMWTGNYVMVQPQNVCRLYAMIVLSDHAFACIDKINHTIQLVIQGCYIGHLEAIERA